MIAKDSNKKAKEHVVGKLFFYERKARKNNSFWERLNIKIEQVRRMRVGSSFESLGAIWEICTNIWIHLNIMHICILM